MNSLTGDLIFKIVVVVVALIFGYLLYKLYIRQNKLKEKTDSRFLSIEEKNAYIFDILLTKLNQIGDDILRLEAPLKKPNLNEKKT